MARTPVRVVVELPRHATVNEIKGQAIDVYNRSQAKLRAEASAGSEESNNGQEPIDADDDMFLPELYPSNVVVVDLNSNERGRFGKILDLK